MNHQIEIDLNRCLCVHSLLQLVDVSLQTILYNRGILPEPYSCLAANDSQKSQQFCDLYGKVTETLKSAFRSFNREILEEVLITFGSPFAPIDIYRIDVKACRLHEDVTESANEADKLSCSTTCGVLSPKERRRIFTSLSCGENAENINHNAPKLGKHAKVFISLKTNGKLVNVIEGLELDESYEPPEPAQIKRLGTRTVRIHSKKCPFEDEDLTVKAEGPVEIWHQLVHVISSL